MEIFIFTTILVTNLFVILILKFQFDSNYKYTSGMYLGVHIPVEHSEDEDVTAIVSSSRRNMRRFLLVNACLSVAICFVCFVDFVIFTLIFIIWICLLIAGGEYLVISSHRRMYALKMKNGWIVESQKRKMYVDTKLSADAGNSHVKGWYHIALMIVQAVLFVPFLKKSDSHIFETMLVLFACSIFITVLALLCHRIIGRTEKNIYTNDSELNFKVNAMIKKNVCGAMLLMSAINTIAWGYCAIATMATDTIVNSTFYVYIFIEVVAALVIAVPIMSVKFKKEEMLSTARVEFIDDDEYWKSGFYYNPNDNRIMVPNRIQSGNYSFNYAFILHFYKLILPWS